MTWGGLSGALSSGAAALAVRAGSCSLSGALLGGGHGRPVGSRRLFVKPVPAYTRVNLPGAFAQMSDAPLSATQAEPLPPVLFSFPSSVLHSYKI